MPLAGFVCPSWVPTAGERVKVEHCLGECPHPCVAPPLLAAIYQAETTNHHTGAYISASMLSGSMCPRQTVYERRHEFYENPTRRYWPFRGTHAHSIIERAGDLVAPMGWLQEIHMSVPITYEEYSAPILDEQGNFTGKYDESKPLVITVGGTTDAYNPIRRELWDFKSMADAKVEMFVTGAKGGDFSPNLDDRWVWQTNIYRWLLGQTPIPADIRKQLKLKGKYFPAPEYLGIQAVGMMNIPRTGLDYIIKTRGKGDYYPREYQYTIDPIPLLPMQDIADHVKTQALRWFKWLVLGDTPPVVAASEKWVCKSCPFNGEKIPGERCYPEKERRANVELE